MMKKVIKFFWWAFRIFILVLFIALIARAWLFRPKVYLQPIANEEHFDLITHLSTVPNDPDQFIVTEKMGLIKTFHRFKDNKARVILDLTDTVMATSTEEGLLTTVLHKDYPNTPYVFVYYNIDKPLRIRLSRFKVNENLTIDKASEVVYFDWVKPGKTHNGGGPMWGADGMLWLAVGEALMVDVGRADELKAKTTVFGSVLRIDPDQSNEGKPYSIPSDNPYVGNDKGIPEEVWATGLRNPWRYSFIDKDTMVIGDVGRDRWEEVNVVKKGDDLGWPTVEGPECFIPEKNCEPEKFKAPQWALHHDVMRSITGGYVYRGEELDWLKGKYLFAGYLRGMFAVDIDKKGVLKNFAEAELNILSFKPPMTQSHRKGRKVLISTFYEDPRSKELYVGAVSGGVYQLRKAGLWYLIKGYFYMLFSFK